MGGSSPDKAGTCQHSLPKSAHPAATRAMQDIFNAEDGGHARIGPKAFQLDYGTKFPKAAAKITDDSTCSSSSQLPGRSLGASANHEPDRYLESLPGAEHLSDKKIPKRTGDHP